MLKFNSPKGSKESRAMGCMVGCAVGDALGKPTEFVRRANFSALFGYPVNTFRRPSIEHPCAHLGANQYTDDTQQAIILAQSLVERKGLDLDDFGSRLAQWGKLCREEPGYDRWAGGASMSAASRLAGGASPYESGSTSTGSCGSCMRVAPIGIYYSDFSVCVQMARLSSIPTHNSEITRDAAASVAGIINLMIYSNLSPMDAAEKVAGLMSLGPMGATLKQAISLAGASPDAAARLIGVGSSAKETAGYAVYSFLHSYTDFEAAVVTAANVDCGDSDSIAAIAGSLCGAYNGLDAIPKKFLAVEDFKMLKELGMRLYSH